MANLKQMKDRGCDPKQHIWTRRDFFGLSGWALVLGSLAVGIGSLVRLLFPRVLFETDSVVKLGPPASYAVNQVSEKWVRDYRIWVVRLQAGLFALSAKCTHLGCTPRWLEAENRFKCPCHGSGFRGLDLQAGRPDITGVNFEGPAPRPLERCQIALGEDGQIVVDVRRIFRRELDDPAQNWEAPGAFLKFEG